MSARAKTAVRPAVIESIEGRLMMAAHRPLAITDVPAVTSDVTTFHDDPARTGADLAETTLTPTDVKAGSFGLLRTLPVDGQVYAQPLYLRGVTVDGAVHNVVYVATEHDDVYAFDSDTGAQLWYRTFLSAGVTTVTSDEVGVDDIYPEIGITGTPVIDPAADAMYLVTKEATTAADGTVTYSQHVRSIDVTTGLDAGAGSMLIQSNLSGSGEGYTGTDDETVPFDPLTENQRPALLLTGGDVYVGYSSHGDNDPYHGWLFAFNEQSLDTDAVIDLSPDGLRAPIWMSGDGPAVDAQGNVFVSTGNGTFDAGVGGLDYGDSVLRLNKVAGEAGHGSQGLVVGDYFSPYDQATINYTDQDLGSSGVLLIPGTHEALTAGKDGNVYVVNTRNLGKFNAKRNNIVQTDKTALGGNPGDFAAAYFDKTVYFAGAGGQLEGFKLVNGKLAAKPVGTSPETYQYPGASPSVSADGTADGIVWALGRIVPASADPGSGMPAGTVVLNAYNAANLAELYTSAADTTNGANATPPGIKFATPTIAGGHVFVGTASGVLEFGLLSAAAATATASVLTGRPTTALAVSPPLTTTTTASPFAAGGPTIASQLLDAGGSTLPR